MPEESFISEHSAEYVLVPNIVTRLSRRFPEVIPIFLWLTREGDRTALEMMSGRQIRLLTVFPRRPKVAGRSPDRIVMKINAELLEYSAASSHAGIAVLAGIPLVSSLSMLRLDAPCCWFELNACPGARDCFVEIALDGTVMSDDSHAQAVSGPLSDEAIQDAASRCLMMPWARAVEEIRKVRSVQKEFHGFRFIGGYKPFHLIMLEP